MVIPQNLQEFRIALGHAVIARLAATLGRPTPAELPLQSYLDAAHRWRSDHADGVNAIVILARRAAAANSPQASITSDLNADALGVRTFLYDAQPEYFRNVVFAGMHTVRPINLVRQHLQVLAQLNEL